SLGKKLGPALIQSIAITGSDLYLREGSDVTLIFHVNNSTAFLAAVAPYLEKARSEFRGALQAKREMHGNVRVESFVSPQREVSLHRAVVDDFVIYSNSAVAVRRVLDTHAGRRPALADALDFRYMRTVFQRDDVVEDGFAFLSDAFIRQLVSPE